MEEFNEEFLLPRTNVAGKVFQAIVSVNTKVWTCR